MRTINYDFSEFLNIFNRMKEKSGASPEDLEGLKRELNRFFEDSVCKEVLYTNNTDKMFFGMKTIARIDADDIFDYLVDDEKIRIGKYLIEIDSHLLDPILNLTPSELMAVLLHEVGHMVNDTTPIENARNALNVYLSNNKDSINAHESIHYKEILAYGLKDYLSKTQSMFYTSDDREIYADSFAATYGFSDSLNSAYKKITNNNIKLYENSEVSKFIVFSWTLSLYKNIKLHRIGALKTLARAKQLTGSRLEAMEMENVIKRIKRIDDSMLNESSNDEKMTLKQKIGEKMRKLRLNDVRNIDNAYYELNMRTRNVEDENDALFIMRQINNSISILTEYMNSDKCSSYERDKIIPVLDKYEKLRDSFSKQIVYKNKNLGIFVNYPDIVENRY